MERNIRFLIAYDGTDFHGWQKQPEMRTVQDVVEQAARRVIRHQVGLNAAGRTDAGVHAAGQQANFETTCEIPLINLQRAIGSRLPKDVSLLHVSEVPLGFRCSHDAVSKLYRYRIYNSARRPVQEHLQRYSYHFWNDLDTTRMQEAANRLVGTHDFAGFASKGSERETTVRTILRADVFRRYDEVFVDVEGTGFLYNQVRNIVGTLLEIGRGHWPPKRIDEILAACDRGLAGPTAPARGLCLQWVQYDLRRPPGWKGLGGKPAPDKTDAAEQP
jgi:tRNA pseudouridine38-40 synthase